MNRKITFPIYPETGKMYPPEIQPGHPPVGNIGQKHKTAFPDNLLTGNRPLLIAALLYNGPHLAIEYKQFSIYPAYQCQLTGKH